MAMFPSIVPTYSRPSGPHAAWVGPVSVARGAIVKLMGTWLLSYVYATVLLRPLGVCTATAIVPEPAGVVSVIALGVTAIVGGASVVLPQRTVTRSPGKKPTPLIVI